MQDINAKVNNGGATAAGQASADEWNQFSLELINMIESTGQTLNGGILTQLGQAMAAHAINGDFTTDSGVADAYVLSPEGSKDAAPGYADGMRLRYIAGNTNTLATVTINYAGKGVKNLVNLSVGALSTTDENIIVFRSGADNFVLKSEAADTSIVNHTFFTNSTRTAIANSNAGTLLTVSYNKQQAGTDLIIAGTLYGFGSGTNGRVSATVQYGAGAVLHGGIGLRQTAAADWAFGNVINTFITGHVTTGAQNLVFGWDFANATSNRPFSILNPNSTDNADISTMVSVVSVLEILP